MGRLENLLGAAAVAISDAQIVAMTEQTGLHPSAAAAVLTLGQHDLLTVSQIAGIVGISHSAMVRLIDGLERKSLVSRNGGKTLREVAISLTSAGRDLYSTLRQSQSAVLGPVVNCLSQEERHVLEAALSRILTTLTHGRDSADRICRFCDETVCGQENCPVERQAVTLANT